MAVAPALARQKALAVKAPTFGSSSVNEGDDHVPSPRQNVVADAPVPLARLPTARLPLTWLARLIDAVVHTTCVPAALAVQIRFAVSAPILGSTSAIAPGEAMPTQVVPLQNTMVA